MSSKKLIFIILYFSFILITFLLFSLVNSDNLSSPLSTFDNYTYSLEIVAKTIDLWWKIDQKQQEITFELHVNTTGWIALGISPAGGMTGADIGLGWIDQTGVVHFEDRYAIGKSQPLIDNTTTNWFALRGRQENGWTAIQFKRALDTCDSMDYPIKSGTNIVIFAYSLEDPVMNDGKATIHYHGDRRFTRMIPLRSYTNQPPESKFADLDYFEFTMNNYSIPSSDTIYHCKIFKVPANLTERRHVIAQNTLIDSANRDLVHHLLMFECNRNAVFDDKNLPEGSCDNETMQYSTKFCWNIALGWAIGGDNILEFPDVAGYPVGGNFSVKYYMIQMHYDNPHEWSNRTDSSGLRFYLGKERRLNEIGTLTFGTTPDPLAIFIPPGMDRFVIDSYCPTQATEKLPTTGITVVNVLPHAHLQGRSIWTKIIRNKAAVGFLFNAEAYNFSYQFTNTLSKPIQLFPGDEFATRCVYSTRDKDTITLGGESAREEMCMHIFTYYPRAKLSACLTTIDEKAWANFLNLSNLTESAFEHWLSTNKWTSESSVQFQKFFNNASRGLFTTDDEFGNYSIIGPLPIYKDLEENQCDIDSNSSANHSVQSFVLIFVCFVIILF